MHASGAGVIVDSSKTSYRRWLRPLRYRRAGYDVRLVHVIRSPHAVLESARKGRNSDLEKGIVRRRRLEVPRTLLSWSFANLAASFYRVILGRQSYVRVRYEDLLADPATELRRISKVANIDVDSVIERIESGDSFDSGHEIAGNRMLRSGSVVFSAKAPKQERVRAAQHALTRGACCLLARMFY
jgi:hypothetical protein